MADTIKINADVSNALQQLDKLSKKVDDFHTKFKNQFDKINSYTAALGAGLVAAGTAVAAFADDISDIAAANDMAISSVLALNKALSASGGKAENAGRLLQTLSQNVEEVNNGNLKSLSSFQRLGISIQDLGALSQDQIRDKLLNNLAGIKDPMERNALATQMFGKALIGVDIVKFAKDQAEYRKEMERFEPSIKAAGDAWDNMVYIVGQLKLAFAEAFGPIFQLIAKLNVNVDLAVVGFRMLGAALIAMTAASVIGGLAKVVTLMKDLTFWTNKNKMVAIVSVLATLGLSAASYLGLSQEIGDQENKNADASNKNAEAAGKGKRNQEGLAEALKKQSDSLKKIRDDLILNWELARKRYALELEMIGLGEDAKKVREEQGKVDEEVTKKLEELNNTYKAMDADSRARNKARYEEEISLIKTKGEEQKRNLQLDLDAIAARKRAQEDLNGSINIRGSGVLEFAKKEIEAIKDSTNNIGERIRIENQFNAVVQERQLIMDKLSKLSDEDKLKVSQALETVIAKTGDWASTTNDLQFAFTDAFSAELKRLGASKSATNEVISGLASQRNAISEVTEVLTDQAKVLDYNSKTFSKGWRDALREYTTNASNAAEQAKRIFQSMTTAMEDLLMNFFKTGKWGWKDFVQTIIDTLMRSQIQQLIAKSFGGLGSIGAGGGKGGLFGGSIIPGFLASGGPTFPNKSYIVGERGPELFVPNTAGTVVPNNSLGGSTNVVYNINAVDAMSFKQMLARDPSFLYAVSEQGRRTLPGVA